jgi:hypothetical protein
MSHKEFNNDNYWCGTPSPSSACHNCPMWDHCDSTEVSCLNCDSGRTAGACTCEKDGE